MTAVLFRLVDHCDSHRKQLLSLNDVNLSNISNLRNLHTNRTRLLDRTSHSLGVEQFCHRDIFGLLVTISDVQEPFLAVLFKRS